MFQTRSDSCRALFKIITIVYVNITLTQIKITRLLSITKRMFFYDFITIFLNQCKD